MARLWSSGFELNSVTADVEWTGTADSPTISTTTIRSGVYAGRISSLSSATTKGFRYNFRVASNTAVYARVYFRVATLPSAANVIIRLLNSDSFFTGTYGGYIKIDNTGALTLFDSDDVQVGSASSALSTNTWYMIDIYYDGSPASGSRILKARLNGTEFASITTGSFSTINVASLGIGGNLDGEAQTTGDWFFDDIAINDTSGSSQTGYPGAGSIVHIHPNAAGDVNNAFSGDWSDIDEITPDDVTTYCIFPTDNNSILVNCESSTTAGIGASDTITLVQVGYRHKASSPLTMSFTPKIESQASGTLLSGTAIDHNDTTWKSNGDDPPKNYKLTSYVDPQAGGAWTPSLLDTMQIGMTVTDATPDLHLSTVWALVEYVPAAGGGGGKTDWPKFQNRGFWSWDFS